MMQQILIEMVALNLAHTKTIPDIS
jgi:hypothetical protein